MHSFFLCTQTFRSMSVKIKNPIVSVSTTLKIKQQRQKNMENMTNNLKKYDIIFQTHPSKIENEIWPGQYLHGFTEKELDKFQALPAIRAALHPLNSNARQIRRMKYQNYFKRFQRNQFEHTNLPIQIAVFSDRIKNEIKHSFFHYKDFNVRNKFGKNLCHRAKLMRLMAKISPIHYQKLCKILSISPCSIMPPLPNTPQDISRIKPLTDHWDEAVAYRKTPK